MYSRVYTGVRFYPIHPRWRPGITNEKAPKILLQTTLNLLIYTMPSPNPQLSTTLLILSVWLQNYKTSTTDTIETKNLKN